MLQLAKEVHCQWCLIRFDGADGIASFELSVNDAAAIDFAAVTGDDLSSNPASITGTFTVDYATLVSLGVIIGNNSLEFTATDTDGDTDSFIHTLTVSEFPTVDVFAAEDGVGEGAASVTWTADNIYILRGFVFVNDGQTLTIEPGTVIKGQTGQGAGASALIVARGGTLIADGTADLPIVFTALADELTPLDIAAGNYASPNLPATLQGQWGGLIVLGNARISESSGGEQLTEQQIEGIPASEERGLYGGSTDTDDSGSISYVSVRHAGTNIGAGNEINGITFGGVGSATTVSWVEVVCQRG